MIVEERVTIRGSKESVWSAISNIEGSERIISGVEKIEVLERPSNGLVGLRWRETRLLFGRPATVEKVISEASEGTSYTTRAESEGFIFLTTMRISDADGGTMLASSHESLPQGLVTRLKSIPMVLFFKGMLKKAILQDLNDIKSAVERG